MKCLLFFYLHSTILLDSWWQLMALNEKPSMDHENKMIHDSFQTKKNIVLFSLCHILHQLYSGKPMKTMKTHVCSVLQRKLKIAPFPTIAGSNSFESICQPVWPFFKAYSPFREDDPKQQGLIFHQITRQVQLLRLS